MQNDNVVLSRSGPWAMSYARVVFAPDLSSNNTYQQFAVEDSRIRICSGISAAAMIFFFA